MAHIALLLIDVEHIKQYVFGTGKLKEIRGASALLDEFNRIKMEEIIRSCAGNGCEKIFAAGGVAMFKIPPDEETAEKVLKEISKKCRERMETVSVSGEWIIVDEDKLERDFNKYQKELIHRLHERHFRQATPDVPLLEGFIKVCDSCGNHPASEERKNEPGQLLCKSCLEKRKQNSNIRRSLFDKSHYKGKKKEDAKNIWEKLLIYLIDCPDYPYLGEEPVQEFNDLGDLCKSRKGYMGLIYCDGNNMGSYIENNIKSAKEMGEFSEKVESALFEAVEKSIVKHLKPMVGGSLLFTMGSILDWKVLLESLIDPKCPYKQRIWTFLNPKCKYKIENCSFDKPIDESLKKFVIAGFNEIINRKDFYEPDVLKRADISRESKEIFNKGVKNLDIKRVRKFNRLLFEWIYPHEIEKIPVGKLPFDVLLLGGDDLVMVTPADKIAEVAIVIADKFKKAMKGSGITLSIGMVIAKTHFPFNQFLEVAEGLLKSAKLELAKKSRNDNDGDCFINFMTISASGSLKFRKEDYTVKPKHTDNELIKTMRPYSIEDMKMLVGLIKKFKEESFPRSPLSFLRETIDRPDLFKARSEMEVIDLYARRRNLRILLRELIYLFDKNFNIIPIPPWIPTEKENIYYTPIIDFTDLYNFVK